MRWSLQVKMFVVFALVATLPLMAMSYLAVTQTRDAFQEEVGRSNLDSAATASGFIGLYVESAQVQLRSEAQSARVRDALGALDRGELLLAVRDFQARTAESGRPLFTSVVAVDANGTVLATYPGTLPEAMVDEAWRRARATGALVTLEANETDRGAVLPMAAPVFVSGELRGALIVALSFGTLGDHLDSLAGRPGESIVLLDARGQVLIHPEGEPAREAAWTLVEPYRRAMQGEDGYVEFDAPRTGERTLAGYAPVGAHGWAVMSIQPTAIAYESVTRLTAVLLVLAADLLVAMLLASVVVARAVVKPLRHLTQAADAMAQGRLGTRIEIGGDDEVGELARSFNVMAERVGSNVEEARRSEERYRSLVESANDMIFTIEPDGSLSFASTLAERLLGQAPADLVGAPFVEHIHPDDRVVYETATSSVLTTGRPMAGVQFRLVHRDGSARVVLTNLSPVMTRLGVPGRVLGVSRDVTLERAQEALREQSFEMARIISEEADMPTLLRRGLDILLAGAGLERGAVFIRKDDGLELIAARALPPGFIEASAKLVREGLMPRTEEPLQDAYERSAPAALRAQGVDVLFTVPLIERAETLGLAVLLASASAQIEPQRRQELGALASQLSVGIRRSLYEARLRGYAAELESKVEERTAMLVEKSQEMESFLYSVSHDLKAPLISIEGYAQGIEEDFGAELPEDAKHYLTRIRKNAELMESLIQDLLEFSRIGRARERAGRVDVGEVVRDVLARVSDSFASAGGEARVTGPLPHVEGESKRIAQLFANLIGNALKYRHPDRPPRVEVSGRIEGGEAVYSVRDNGRGMPASAREKAFQIFQRFPVAGMDDPGGTGMGLAIVKRIADMHGGRVWFETRPGDGTTFHVALPLKAGGSLA